jgi:hypothetical protein
MSAFAICGHERRGYVHVRSVRDVARRGRARRKIIFPKSENRKSENQKIAIKKNANFFGNFASAKNGSRKQRRCKPFIRFVLSLLT